MDYYRAVLSVVFLVTSAAQESYQSLPEHLQTSCKYKASIFKEVYVPKTSGVFSIFFHATTGLLEGFPSPC